MVVDDLYPVRIAVLPDEADAPLVVDTNAVLPCPVALQRFKPVSGGKPYYYWQVAAPSPSRARLTACNQTQPVLPSRSLDRAAYVSKELLLISPPHRRNCSVGCKSECV